MGTYSGDIARFGEVSPWLKLAVPPVCNGCRLTQTSEGIWLQDVQLKRAFVPKVVSQTLQVTRNYRKQLPTLQLNMNHKQINENVTPLQNTRSCKFLSNQHPLTTLQLLGVFWPVKFA